MSDTNWQIDAVGDRCLLLRLGDSVDTTTRTRVHALVQRLREAPIAGVRDIVPAFATVALHYRPECFGDTPFDTPFEALRAQLLERLVVPLVHQQAATRTVEIPVCYGGASGPDLDGVAQRCGLSAEQVVQRHLASDHQVQMLGFAPGFPFIAGLDPALAMPRRSTPRIQIPAGSVAIAREQTCIYPLQTPGGWNILGRTPLRLFDASAASPCLLTPGDHIRFVRIDEQALASLLEGQA